MTFEWDESKNGINREKHGLDFDAVFIFDWETRWLQTARGAATVNNGMRRWSYTPGEYISGFYETRSQYPDYQPETIQSSRGKSL